MKQRAIEFQQDICSVQANEWDNYTYLQWQAWFAAWNDYVNLGGTRPPRRPPI